MAAQDRPFACVIVPFPRPQACQHPYWRCTTELDERRHPLFRCECGVTRPVADWIDRQMWARLRIGAIARALQADMLEEAERLSADMHDHDFPTEAT